MFQAFGLLYGFDALPDIIDPDDFVDEAITAPVNMYSIASPKANAWTGRLLEELGKRWAPRLEFRANETSRNLRNISVSIYSDNALLQPDGWDFVPGPDRYRKDFGLIVRAPNPHHADSMVTIMAGRSSLGTEAACIGFTDPAKVDEIRQHLPRIDLEDHRQPFWALVRMERTIGDGREEAIPESWRLDRVRPLRPMS
jgi:hypothetical protein